MKKDKQKRVLSSLSVILISYIIGRYIFDNWDVIKKSIADFFDKIF